METIILEEKRITHQNDEVAIHDLGDGIGCLAFRSKGNSISPTVREFLLNAVSWHLLGYDGLVIGNQSKNFSVGANLYSIKEDIDKRNFKAFDDRVRSFQTMTMTIKLSRKPVVAAPYRNTLGGGLEVALHAQQRIALRKSFMGLVEIGVGLIPGGGGTKECALMVGRTDPARNEQVLKDAFNKLVTRSVSGSAEQAVELGYLKKTDRIVEMPEELIGGAKELCLELLAKGIPNKDRGSGHPPWEAGL